MKKSALLTFSLLFAAAPLFADSQTIQGAVTNTDDSNQRITVRYMKDVQQALFEDVLIGVPDAAIITKGGDDREFVDLEEGDRVTVTYDTSTSVPSAVSIVVAET